MKKIEVKFPLIEDITMEGKEGIKCTDWFFCTKPISKETVLKTVLKK